ncbi:hypothetical protein B5M45_16040 [Mycobacterium simiae]|uniref:Uncharacterized protein n=1 Tax=Mycobacterium simiae TaxID=1784 RepID=A0A1X0Y2R1_MYCSI|nr:hypothetical protein B5M45_16040 [Mycobacterium simiae]
MPTLVGSGVIAILGKHIDHRLGGGHRLRLGFRLRLGCRLGRDADHLRFGPRRGTMPTRRGVALVVAADSFGDRLFDGRRLVGRGLPGDDHIGAIIGRPGDFRLRRHHRDDLRLLERPVRGGGRGERNRGDDLRFLEIDSAIPALGRGAATTRVQLRLHQVQLAHRRFDSPDGPRTRLLDDAGLGGLATLLGESRTLDHPELLVGVADDPLQVLFQIPCERGGFVGHRRQFGRPQTTDHPRGAIGGRAEGRHRQ